MPLVRIHAKYIVYPTHTLDLCALLLVAAINGISWHISNSVPPTDTYERATCHVLTLFVHTQTASQIDPIFPLYDARVAQYMMGRSPHIGATFGMVWAAKNISFGATTMTMLENRWQQQFELRPMVWVWQRRRRRRRHYRSQLTLLTASASSFFAHMNVHHIDIGQTPYCVHILSAQNGFCDGCRVQHAAPPFCTETHKKHQWICSRFQNLYFSFSDNCEQKPTDLFLASSINLPRIIFVALFAVTFAHMHEPASKTAFCLFSRIFFFRQRNGWVEKKPTIADASRLPIESPLTTAVL